MPRSISLNVTIKEGSFHGPRNLADYRQNTKFVWSHKLSKHKLKPTECIN